jgi:AAA15 family ATPase/GTPase
MDIKFTGKYKSITAFEWLNIPHFAVITGPNGTGKSQLLQLIYNTIVNHNVPTKRERVTIEHEIIKRHEVSLIKGEWKLNNTDGTDFSKILQERHSYFSTFRSFQDPIHKNRLSNNLDNIQLYETFQSVSQKINKPPYQITQEEFESVFPEIILEKESALSIKIESIFYDYRINEINLRGAKYKEPSEIRKELGEPPWTVLREILKESKLPFIFNDPSNHDIKDRFYFRVTNQITGDQVNFNDLSSGEKVIISLIFYLYTTQEKNIFPKLLLLDEPDAHLHPTMSQQFLNVIKNVLVDKYNVRVIMTTHSPSTVALTEDESLFEMSRTNPRIQKSPSKNHTISLLTSGLVYVGQGTRYFLVEDEDDRKFYSYLYDYLTSEGILSGDIPCVFIPASTNNKSGGKSVVSGWVNKLKISGLEDIIQGVIDNDEGNATSQGIYKIQRYSIENYLIDPIVTYAAFMDNNKHNDLLDLGLKLGEEYRLKTLPTEQLQQIADTIFDKVEKVLHQHFNDYQSDKETRRQKVSFTNGITLEYPQWILKRKGKTLSNSIYHDIFDHKNINFNSLFKAFQKANFIPSDIVYLFNRIREIDC